LGQKDKSLFGPDGSIILIDHDFQHLKNRPKRATATSQCPPVSSSDLRMKTSLTKPGQPGSHFLDEGGGFRIPVACQRSTAPVESTILTHLVE
jgi:hypothetical protein